jgi:hypothetical protein
MPGYKPTGRPPGRPKRRPSTSATPIDDWRMGDLPLSAAAIRYVELCNGITTQDVGDAFAANPHERDSIQQGIRLGIRTGRLRVEGTGPERLLFPVRFARRRAS